MFAITKSSKALGTVVYEGGRVWAPAKPFSKPLTFNYRSDAEVMARGLGDKSAKVIDVSTHPLDWAS